MCDGSEIKEDYVKVGLELHNIYRKAHGAEPMCIDAEVRTQPIPYSSCYLISKLYKVE